MSSESKFDVEVVADEIKRHLVRIEKNEASLMSHKRKAAELLQDVAMNHPNELEEVCRLAGLHESRIKELMQIARRKKTPREIKDATKRRVADHRAKKKTTTALLAPKLGPLHPPVTATQNGLEASPATAEHNPIHMPTPDPGPLQGDVTATQNGVDLEASAATAEHNPIHMHTLKPPVSKSIEALTEFRYAVEHWLPKVKRAERMSAWEYARQVGEKLNAADDATAASCAQEAA
jgi:hypothetical protein